LEKCTATHYAWITEEDGISLGDDAADPNAVTFVCGLYDLDGDIDEGNNLRVTFIDPDEEGDR
jgi:hypothetical protein